MRNANLHPQWKDTTEPGFALNANQRIKMPTYLRSMIISCLTIIPPFLTVNFEISSTFPPQVLQKSYSFQWTCHLKANLRGESIFQKAKLPPHPHKLSPPSESGNIIRNNMRFHGRFLPKSSPSNIKERFKCLGF